MGFKNSRQIYPTGHAGPDNQRPDKWSSAVLSSDHIQGRSWGGGEGPRDGKISSKSLF